MAMAGRKQAWSFGHYRVLSVLYFSYFSNIFSRTAVQVSLAAMQADASLHFTPAMTATVLGSGAGVQVAGKLLGASVLAKLGPLMAFWVNHTIMFSGLTLMTLPIGGAFNFPRFLAGWTLNMWSAATMWPSMTSIAGEAFKDNGFTSAVGLLSTSSRVGAILGNIVWGALAAKFSWVLLIRAASVFSICSALALKYFVLPYPAPPAAADSPKEDVADAEVRLKVPFAAAMRIFARNPRLWMIYFVQAMMTLCMEAQALLPVYLRQGAGLSAAAAGAMAAVYPLGAAGATVVGGAIFDRFTGTRRAALFGLEHLCALGGLGLLAGSPGSPTSFALLAIMAGTAPTFYLVTADFINRYAGPDYAGTLMSWLDVPGQLGNMLFISLYPSMVERGGWSLVFRTLQGTTLCGSAVCIAYLLLDGKCSTSLSPASSPKLNWKLPHSCGSDADLYATAGPESRASPRRDGKPCVKVTSKCSSRSKCPGMYMYVRTS